MGFFEVFRWTLAEAILAKPTNIYNTLAYKLKFVFLM